MQSSSQPLRVRPEIDQLSRLVEYVEAFAAQHELSVRDTYALNLAAEELFTNTVHYGTPPPATFVEFRLIKEPGSVQAIYRDDGPEYDPTKSPVPDVTLPAADRPVGGLGIYLIESTMDDFRYQRSEGCNQIHFTRRVSS